MTYDDVADIKAALQVMLLLLERIANTLDHLDDSVADIASALTPAPPEDDA